MDNTMLKTMLFGLVVALAPMSLNAQTTGNESDETVAKVQTDGGVIMISEGGEFQTAVPDQRVKAKARLMVSEESSATVVYDDGCDQKYDEPGVYEISSTCVLPIALSSGGVSRGWIVAGGIVGAAILVAVLDDDDDDDTRPPVSR